LSIGGQNATLGVAFSGRLEFATCNVANLRDPIAIDRIEGSKVAQIDGGKQAVDFVGGRRGPDPGSTVGIHMADHDQFPPGLVIGGGNGVNIPALIGW